MKCVKRYAIGLMGIFVCTGVVAFQAQEKKEPEWVQEAKKRLMSKNLGERLEKGKVPLEKDRNLWLCPKDKEELQEVILTRKEIRIPGCGEWVSGLFCKKEHLYYIVEAFSGEAMRPDIARANWSWYGPFSVSAQKQKKPLKQRLEDSYKKAADWLTSQQEKSGAFKAGKFPSAGYTALVAYTLASAPAEQRKPYQAAVDRAVGYLLAQQSKEDGSFSEMGGSNKTYVTSVALMTLAVVDKEKYKDAIAKAQNWLVKHQHGEGIYKGGMGYGDIELEMKDGKLVPEKRGSADVSNTGFAAEALNASGLDKNSEYWKNMTEFLTRCQNNSETNKDPELLKLLGEKGKQVGNDGGLRYTPDSSKAGEDVLDNGKKVLRSYGSMTYEGLKSFIYAGLTKDDPRVKAAYGWVESHYSLDSHPGFGIDEVKRTHLQGLYYYYMMFAKGLDVWGEATLKTSDGKEHKWAEELAEKLLSLQAAEETRAWQNKSPRWGEGDSVLATSYSLICYNTLFKWLK